MKHLPHFTSDNGTRWLVSGVHSGGATGIMTIVTGIPRGFVDVRTIGVTGVDATTFSFPDTATADGSVSVTGGATTIVGNCSAAHIAR